MHRLNASCVRSGLWHPPAGPDGSPNGDEIVFVIVLPWLRLQEDLAAATSKLARAAGEAQLPECWLN
ncbi:MAG: hypothetical protein DWQ37_09250 [Planctomycetota bacterium]|nr:MAG: hypothetical protein DWQ37_09250 [Planctomycetota bacterium]